MRKVIVLSTTVVVVGGAAMLLHAQVDGSGQTKSSPGASAVELAALEDWVARAEITHKRIHALFRAGAPGGEVEEEALARYQMSLAKARLADVQGMPVECDKWYIRAIEAAERGVEGTEAAFDAGTVNLDRLVFIQQQMAEIQIEYSRYRVKRDENSANTR